MYSTASDDNSRVQSDVLHALMEALTLTEQVNGSQDHFMGILDYGKRL